MDMFQYVPARYNELSLHGYCSNYSSINNNSINHEEDPLITATQSDTNPLSFTSKEEQVEEEEGSREKEEEEYKREKEEKKEKEEQEGKRKKSKRVKISKDPQNVAARNRRHRISQKMRILRKLVPGGMKMDTASMLDEAVQYLKCLKAQLVSMEAFMKVLEDAEPIPFPFPMPMDYYY